MKRRWFSPTYWVGWQYMNQFVRLVEANPWLMENARVRTRLDGLLHDARRLGWLDEEAA